MIRTPWQAENALHDLKERSKEQFLVVHLQKGERRVQESVCAEGDTGTRGDAQQLSPQRQRSQTDPEICAKIAKKKRWYTRE